MKPKKIGASEAKTHLSRLLARVHAGEEIVIAKSGEPYARLVPLGSRQPKREPATAESRLSLRERAFFRGAKDDNARSTASEIKSPSFYRMML